MDYEISTQFLPSHVAAAAVYIARRMFEITPFWTPTLEHHAKYGEEEVKTCAMLLNARLNAIYHADKAKDIAVRTKFAGAQHFNVSCLEPLLSV